MKKSRTVIRRRQSESPALRHLPLVDILVDAQAELQELVVQSGLKVLEAMLEEDRVAVCGPRYAHPPERRASRAGHAPSEVVLGGRTVALRRPRVRHAGQEVAVPTFRAFAADDPLNRRVVEQMLVGVATRQYGRSLEPLGPDVRTRGTSKRAVSRRFVAQTQAQLDAWRATPLADLDLAVLLLDGVHVGHHCIVVALGIDVTGQKPRLGCHRVTAAAYAARVCGLRIWAVTKLHRPLRGLRSGAPDRGREALDLPAPGHDERFWRGGHRCEGDGLRPPSVGAAALGAGAVSVAWSRRPITPFMHYPPPRARGLCLGRPSTNLAYSMRARHRPTSHAPPGV